VGTRGIDVLSKGGGGIGPIWIFRL
jgi:hypothetical protein